MLRVSIDRIEAGMVLARPVPLPARPHRNLLPRNAEIPLDVVPHLRKLGIDDVWIRWRNLEFLDRVIDEDLEDQQRELYCRVRSNFEQVMRHASLELDLTHFENSIADLFAFLKQRRFGNVLLQKLDAFDNYLMSHSTNVCYVALLVGMKLQSYVRREAATATGDGPDLRHLGLGCLLHDVGKMRIPPEILNKPSKLTPEEFEIMKTHTALGCDMLEGRAEQEVAEIVLHHHQRWDGNGYPHRVDPSRSERLPPLTGAEIPIFCRIATMADIYDAATSKRCYSEAKPPVQVLHEMRTWCRGAFDPVVERAFYEVIPAFPVGSLVTLSDGIEAVVVDFNPRHPVRPKVQCLRTPTGEDYADPAFEEIDLSLYPDIEIVRTGDVDVRPFLELQRAHPVGDLEPAPI